MVTPQATPGNSITIFQLHPCRLCILTEILALDGLRVERDQQVVAGFSQLLHGHAGGAVDPPTLVELLSDSSAHYGCH